MKTLGAALAISVISVCLAGSSLHAKDRTPASITVAFGAGLNTALPGNTPNHHVIPQESTVRITKAMKLDGTVVFVPATVNFIVSGFHFPWVYNKGVNPGTPPTFADANVNPSGVQNRTDSFGFSTPGRYLVICNVRGHFVDGM